MPLAEYAAWVQQEVNKWTRLREGSRHPARMTPGDRAWTFASPRSSSIWHDTVHEFMEKEVGREYTREHDASREFPVRRLQEMAAQGWLGLLLPEEDGGVAADPVMFAIFCEAIAKYSLDTAACIMTSMFTATNISSHGTPAQKAEVSAAVPARRGDILDLDQRAGVRLRRRGGADQGRARRRRVGAQRQQDVLLRRAPAEHHDLPHGAHRRRALRRA